MEDSPLTQPEDQNSFPPSALRNRDPILDVLRGLLSEPQKVLEIASGSGAHALHFATQMPHLTWQPTEAETAAVANLSKLQAGADLPNLLPPLHLDVTAPQWPATGADAIVAINMIHIAPWEATRGLLAGAEQILKQGGLLFLYGPFEEDDRVTAASNAAFDQSLKQRNPRWGLRNLSQVCALAQDFGLELVARFEMPANNLSVVFRRS